MTGPTLNCRGPSSEEPALGMNADPASLERGNLSPAPSARLRRRLSAVLALDAVGYSQRMEVDEDRVYQSLRGCRSLMRALIEEHGGRVVGTPGDFLLALFESGGSAVEAALAVQTAISTRNREQEASDRLEFRAGIALGDVIEEHGEAYGTAVNLAARLQTLAAPGRVVVSDPVHHLLKEQKTLTFRNLGEQRLKHIREPMRVHLVHGSAETVPLPLPLAEPEEEPAPRRPFLVIEPFKWLSPGESAQLLAAGVTDELLTSLSRLTGSLAVYDIRSADMTGPDRYRLEGVVRLLPDRLRLTARLIRADDSVTIWADRLEYRMDQTIDLSETIAREVITALQITLTEGEQARLWSRRTTSGRAWELFLKGHDLERRYRRETHLEARSWYERSLSEDPGYVVAIVAQAFCHVDEVRLGWSPNPEVSLAEAERLAERAGALDPGYPDLFALRAFISFARGDHAGAIELGLKAVALEPRGAELNAYLGSLYDTLGRQEEAVEAYQRAMALSPYHSAWLASNLGLAYCIMGRLAASERAFRQVVRHHPDYQRAYIGLTVVESRLGHEEEARRAAAMVRRLDPLFSAEEWARAQLYTDPAVVEAFVADLKRAGIQ
ncbi:MAG TPA: adenylate/guanylate cyclase domain-containing protein [Alphaproteobacteria bacterium]|nr:adenylate/guanylate cyclase domain-containing protein [Alphaproteobacteria bacterium]